MLVRLSRGAERLHPNPLTVLDRFEPNTAGSSVKHVCVTSKQILGGLAESSSAVERVHEARGAWQNPNTAASTARRAISPTTSIHPAVSSPGGPGSPGYSPSTLSTSRKLRPTARTRTRISACTGVDVASCCGSMKRLLRAPREWKCNRISLPQTEGARRSREASLC
eukprot:2462333-Prymnesium_polylepis.4